MTAPSGICRFCGAVCSPGNRCHNCGDYDEVKHRASLHSFAGIEEIERERRAAQLPADNVDDQPKPPPELDAIARKVLSYKPKPKLKPAKARKQRAAKVKRDASK